MRRVYYALCTVPVKVRALAPGQPQGLWLSCVTALIRTGRQWRSADALRLGPTQALRLRTLGVNRSSFKINEQRRRDLLTY